MWEQHVVQLHLLHVSGLTCAQYALLKICVMASMVRSDGGLTTWSATL